MRITKIIHKIFCFLISSFLLCVTLCSCSSPNADKAEACLLELYDDLEVVTEYLSEYDYHNIVITKADGTMNLLLKEIVQIEDEEVVSSIKSLFDSGIGKIYKSDEYNAIKFLRWRRFNDFGAGLIYAINDESEPSVTYQTEMTSLSKDGWYYYEEDFNEWKLQKRASSTEEATD